MNELPIDMISGVPMVYVKIWSRNKNAFRSILLTLDTGAAVTTISKDILQFLGYDLQSTQKRRIITASGVEYADIVVLDKIVFAGYEHKNAEIYAHTFPLESFSKGVIGVDILSEYDLFISFKQRLIRVI